MGGRHKSESVDDFIGMRTNLYKSSFRKANLIKANLNRADLSDANLRNAKLYKASVRRAKLAHADLRGADLRKAHCGKTDFLEADLRRANLSGAVLVQAQFVDAKLQHANLSNCFVYGVSAWAVDLRDADQRDLIITPKGQPEITVDNLEVSQFIYLILNNKKIRDVIGTVARKGVLILGRFTPERKAVLDAIRQQLRNCNFVPLMFDFEKPPSRNYRDTLRTLALMSRFVIVDITTPKIVLQELEYIRDIRVPIQPIIQRSGRVFSTFKSDFAEPLILEIHRYTNSETLLASLSAKVIAPADQKAKELEKR